MGANTERVLRLAAVLLLAPFALRRGFSLLIGSPTCGIVMLAFAALPLLSLLMYPDPAFTVATWGPYVVSGLSILCLCGLRSQDLHTWLGGMGAVAFVFVAVGAFQYGLQSSTYFGRERVHLGFIHPTQTAAAVVVSAAFLWQLLVSSFRRASGLRRVLQVALLTATGYVMVVVGSRNSVLVVAISLVCWGYASVVRQRLPRIAMLSVLLAVPIVLYTVAVRSDIGSSEWAAADEFTSHRVEAYRSLSSKLGGETLISVLFGPTMHGRAELVGQSFASSESVYMSVFINFGLLSFAGLLILLLHVGHRLSQGPNQVAYGLLCGAITYFAIDAQGITPSNLAVFVPFSYAVRVAVTSRQRLPSRVPLQGRQRACHGT